MAYSKKPYRKKALYKKPVRYQVADMALSAFNGVKAIKRLINVEKKNHDIANSLATVSTGTIHALTTISQGASTSTRVGDSIKPLYLNFRGYIENVHISNSGQVRIIVFRGKKENAITPLVSDVLASLSVISQYNYTDINRFTILKDKTYVINPGTAITASTAVQFNLSCRLDGHIKYVTGGTTIEQGGLYVLYITNNSVQAPAVYYNQRLTFTDN